MRQGPNFAAPGVYSVRNQISAARCNDGARPDVRHYFHRFLNRCTAFKSDWRFGRARLFDFSRRSASPAESDQEHLAVRERPTLTVGRAQRGLQGNAHQIDRPICEILRHRWPQVAIFMDDDVIGFGIQVRETGRKSFTLDYTFEGRRRRLFIGDFPEWTTVAARDGPVRPAARPKFDDWRRLHCRVSH